MLLVPKEIKSINHAYLLNYIISGIKKTSLIKFFLATGYFKLFSDV